MIDSKDLNDLHPALKRGATELIRRMKEKGYAVGISSTYRDSERQNAIYAQGRTTPGAIVTQLKGGQSMHNYRLAFDIFQNVKGKEFSDSAFFKTAGTIWEQMGGEWGGSWTGFVDPSHFQFTNGLTISQLQQGSTVPQNAKMKWESQAPTAQTATPPTTNYKVVRVTTTLNIRKDSNTQSAVVGTLKNNDIVKVSDIKNGFAKTAAGWVSLLYLEKL